MRRLGFAREQLKAVFERMAGQKLLGLMTHFASADDPDSGRNESSVASASKIQVRH